MTISSTYFALLIFVALTIVVVAPLILLSLWVVDAKKGRLW